LFRWLVAFLFTQIVEVPIWVFVLRKYGRTRRSLAASMAIAFGASAITHPFVWFGFPRLFADYTMMVVFAESFAVIVEAIYMIRFGLRRALFWSIVANGASAGLGYLSRMAFGWP
jgi:hypothetical protein